MRTSRGGCRARMASTSRLDEMPRAVTLPSPGPTLPVRTHGLLAACPCCFLLSAAAAAAASCCRVVTANNPAVPSGLVIYNFHDRAYKAVPETADQHVSVHLAMTGASPVAGCRQGRTRRMLLFRRCCRSCAGARRGRFCCSSRSDGVVGAAALSVHRFTRHFLRLLLVRLQAACCTSVRRTRSTKAPGRSCTGRASRSGAGEGEWWSTATHGRDGRRRQRHRGCWGPAPLRPLCITSSWLLGLVHHIIMVVVVAPHPPLPTSLMVQRPPPRRTGGGQGADASRPRRRAPAQPVQLHGASRAGAPQSIRDGAGRAGGSAAAGGRILPPLPVLADAHRHYHDNAC